MIGTILCNDRLLRDLKKIDGDAYLITKNAGWKRLGRSLWSFGGEDLCVLRRTLRI